VIVEGLNSIPGFRCHKPLGAFYVFPNIQGTGRTAKFLADYLLNERCRLPLRHGVRRPWGGYLRFSYANSVENIVVALERVKEAVAKL